MKICENCLGYYFYTVKHVCGANSGSSLQGAEELVPEVIQLCRLSLKLGLVNRVTFHEDGVTPESDTDHTVMLSLVACSYAEAMDLDLSIGRVAEFAIVHDLVEAECGDTDTLGISAAGRAAKEVREREALERIRAMFPSLSWVATTIDAYESLEEPEARFVKVLDKVLPKVTHLLNGGATLDQRGITAESLTQTNGSQREKIAATYGADQPEAMALLLAMHEELIRSVRKRSSQ